MTHDEQLPDGPVSGDPAWHYAIDALLDGEAVERDTLRRALNDASARDYFIDAVSIRQLTRELGPSRFVATQTPPGPVAKGIQWLAAVLILVVGAGIGYGYGQKAQDPAALPGSVEVVLGGAPAPPAPEPTRHFRFEPGVNWSSDAGRK